MVSFIEHLQEG